MINYSSELALMNKIGLSDWAPDLGAKISATLTNPCWGDLPRWISSIDALPDIETNHFDFNDKVVTIGKRDECTDGQYVQINQQLRQLCPWRKGPFNLFGVDIDAEWRSDLKWDRIRNNIEPLRERLILDVGCSSGYHCFRMIGEGAKCAIGIDPTMLYAMQFQVFCKYLNCHNVMVLPVGIDDMPENMAVFDTVFSMGLLYHRRSPLDHLLQLKNCLRQDGQLVLETIIIDGTLGQVLNPEGRYAKMKNVWFIPSVPTLESWLKKVGFASISVIDQTVTTSDEQRVTDWMGDQSLADFLDPNDTRKTVEGYPAPKRAIVTAKKI